jgi:hypothetical protein
MTRLTLIAAGAASLFAGGLAMPAPSFAQAQAEILVFGTDPCPRSTDDAVVVCRRLPETMRYRMPDQYRDSSSFQEKQSWTNKAKTMQTVGSTGIGSCSAVGPGGYTGCLTQEIQAARQARQQAEQEATAPEQ